MGEESGHNIDSVSKKTPAVGEPTSLTHVKRDGRNLFYVRNQTREVCMAAVKQNPEALQYVHYQTPEICMEAIKSCEHRNQTKRVWSFLCGYIKTPAFVQEALEANPAVAYCIEDWNHELAVTAAKQSPWSLECIPCEQKTTDVCAMAMRDSGEDSGAWELVPKNILEEVRGAVHLGQFEQGNP